MVKCQLCNKCVKIDDRHLYVPFEYIARILCEQGYDVPGVCVECDDALDRRHGDKLMDRERGKHCEIN